MSEQRKMEIIKALGYGENPMQIAEAEGIDISTVEGIQRACAADIAEERDMLGKAGYIHD
ncbi:MAG TPA: hypothetical protein VHO71_04790 [Caproiciproducens sp.]|nr:hypothetical protein [Caproiciproducens sp.]